MKRTPYLVLASCLALGACTTSSSVTTDAGPTGPVPPLPRGSFLCSASLRSSVQGGPLTSDSNSFTLVLDPDARRAIAGGGGKATVIDLTSDDGRTFRSSQEFDIGVSQAPCAKILRIAYTSLVYTTDGSFGIVGRVSGSALVSIPGTPMYAPFEANFFGQPDNEPPRLVVPDGVQLDDPIMPFQLWTSEPLPATALARMVAGDGAVSGLVPEIIDGPVPLIASFAKANTTLNSAQTFQALFSDDVVDLAGHLAPKGATVPLGTIPPALYLDPDGFESATTETLGASILRTGPGITPINGAQSAYIGLPISPNPTEGALKSKLVVRMFVPPGATKLTFSYRELADGNRADPGFVQLGSVGRAPGPEVPIPTPTIFDAVTYGARTFFESPVATMTVPLPDEIGQEVVVMIRTGPTICDASGGRPGLLIDDLRIE
jgi:hypothetical protein